MIDQALHVNDAGGNCLSHLLHVKGADATPQRQHAIDKIAIDRAQFRIGAILQALLREPSDVGRLTRSWLVQADSRGMR